MRFFPTMPYLTVAILVVGSLCLLDLVLTLGVIRRLREHTERLSALSAHPPSASLPDLMLPVGQAPADFETTTIDGDRVSRDLLGAPALVGFFAPGCGPCKERVPEFAAYAEAVSGAGQYTLAVVVGSGEDVRELAGGFGDASRVVVEAPGGPVSTAFGVHGFPALCALDDTGAIVATGTTLDRLPSPLTS
jgi:thiol-disulfide isomerase/thioredoxin